MSFRRRPKSRLIEAALDMTPMIDVVFLLVIFLLISTTFKKKQLALELNLPRVGNTEYRVAGNEHQLRIESDGSLFLCPNEVRAEDSDAMSCTTPTGRENLTEALKELVARYPGTRLGVYANSDVRYDHIARIVAAAIEAGIDLNLPYKLESEE